MFKMYFVKTDKPNVFHRVDEIARVLLDTDVYPDNNTLTQKQATYYNKAIEKNLPSWNKIIGFTYDKPNEVIIHKPIPEMIRTAKEQFDIDLYFVDEKPNIPFNDTILIDVELQEFYDDEQYEYNYWIAFGKYEMSDILAVIDVDDDNTIYRRISTAVDKYLYQDPEYIARIIPGCISISPKLEEIMKKDFKENFNINLYVKHESEKREE